MSTKLLEYIILTTVIALSFAFTALAGNEFDHVAKGAILQNQKKYQEAIEEYEKAIKIAPDFIEAYSSLGYIYQYDLKNLYKAIEIYLKGLKHSPDNYGLNLNLMHAYFELGDLENGVKQYEVLAKIRPDNKRYYFPRKIIQKIIFNFTEEDKYNFCKRYLALNPTDTILREILIDIYKSRKDYKNAENELQNQLKYDEPSGSVYFDLGTCNYHLGNYENSLKFFKRAEELGVYVPQAFFDKLHLEIAKSDKN